MEVKIDIYDLAHQLNDENYNNLIVELFANANDDAHIELLKRMWEYIFDADKEEFLDWVKTKTNKDCNLCIE